MGCFYSSKRGLSTVVTSAMLLSSVAVLGTLVIDWSNSNLLNRQSYLESTFSANTNKLNEYLVVENVWFGGNDPTKYVNITLTNVGEIGLNVTKIEFVDPIDDDKLASYVFTNGGMLSKKSFSVTPNFSWQDNSAFDIVVTTLRDSIYRIQVLP